MNADANILVSGANGYIGRRLIASLLEKGYSITAMVRSLNNYRSIQNESKKFRIVVADLHKQKDLNQIKDSYDCAYYLVHSMSNTKENLCEQEVEAARNFRLMAERVGVKQIIYLGGIYNSDSLSPHLLSRKLVEKELRRGKVPVTCLRSAIIVGSGSASFEMIRDLTEKLPLMITPKWLNTKCQPIAIRDCIRYLVGVLGVKETFNQCYDIGGPDILSYKQMLLIFAKIRGLKRYIITIPLLTPRLSSYWLTLVTAVPFQLAQNLVNSLKNDVIAANEDIKKVVPGKCISYEESIHYAFKRIQTNDVLSNWSDEDPGAKLATKTVHVPEHACYKDIRIFDLKNHPTEAKRKVMSIGGDNGWYTSDWLWSVRGYLDKMVGGVGLRRGRRNPSVVTAGDTIDFWRVLLADNEPTRLLLYAEMKLPGEAWLDFKIVFEEGKYKIVQIASFRPKGLLGRLYWYSVLPLHSLIFPSMAKKIAGW